MSNSETAKKSGSESIQIEAIVPKTPKVCVETRQVPVEDGENVFLEGCKGQLISEWLFGVLNFPKKQRKSLKDFWPRI